MESRILVPVSDLPWLSIVGAVGGVIGALGGVVGSVLGYMGYRRARDGKALDLRLELRKAESDVRGVVGGLPDLIERAKLSRVQVFEIDGRGGSRALNTWKASCDTDRKNVDFQKNELSELDLDSATLTDYARLESALSSVYDLKRRASEMQAKYEEELANDRRSRAARR